MILQKLKYGVKSDLDLAEKYYGIISIANKLSLTKREIQMMAFTAVRGNIGSATAKKEYVDTYNSSLATVGNMLSKLSKMHLLIKEDDSKIVVNKAINLDFSEGITLAITFENVDSKG